MPIERILEAENIAESGSSMLNVEANDIRDHPGFAGDVENQTTKKKMLHQLVEWAKHVPHFTDLKIDDQVLLQEGRASPCLDGEKYFFPYR